MDGKEGMLKREVMEAKGARILLFVFVLMVQSARHLDEFTFFQSHIREGRI